MWKTRPEDNRPSLTPSHPAQAAAAPAIAAVAPNQPPKPSEMNHADVGHIGKSVVIRGELSGSEDLYLDGEVEGNINLHDHKLVIGPNGKIKAAITARDVVLHGRVEGNVSASERLELKRASTLTGDVTTHRIVIEDGAFFKGAIDIREHREAKTEIRKPATASAAGSGSSSSLTGSPTLSAGPGPGVQGSFLEPK